MQKSVIKVGPTDHGRRMSLADFEHAEVVEEHLYELNRGVIEASDVPHRRHAAQIQAIRIEVIPFMIVNPTTINLFAAGNECQLLIESVESERHPDLTMYLKAAPNVSNYWRVWIPEIVIEVVSKSSEHRDYVEKREEYKKLGVTEYWIVDSFKRQMLALTRSTGDWSEQIVRPPALYSTPLLPGFEFSVEKVFAAADA